MSTMIDKKDDAFLAQNIKGLMMTLLEHWNREMDQGREGTEFADIRPGDMRLFGQLRGEQVPLSDIHRKMGFSRQAAKQAVDRLVAQDMLVLEAVPGSRRDKMVCITEKGQRRRALAARQIGVLEERCAEVIGDAGREGLRKALLALVSHEKDRISEEPGSG